MIGSGELDEVFEAGVEMRLHSNRSDSAEMTKIYMSKHSEHSLVKWRQSYLEILGKRDCGIGRKEAFVLHLFLDPFHETINILRGRESSGLLYPPGGEA